MYLICLIHHSNQLLSSFCHSPVIKCANIKVKIFKRFCIHSCKLRHRRSWPTQNTPLRVIQTLFHVNRNAVNSRLCLHSIGRYSRGFINIVSSPESNVGIHPFHTFKVVLSHNFKCLICSTSTHCTRNLVITKCYMCIRSNSLHNFDKFNHHFSWHINRFN